LLYNFTLKDILDLIAKIYGIGNFGGMVMFSMYHQFGNKKAYYNILGLIPI